MKNGNIKSLPNEERLSLNGAPNKHRTFDESRSIIGYHSFYTLFGTY
ncbi:MAG: hypothetical protein ACI352_02835 [Elusimicrobiaceae bacterium]